MHAPTAPSRIYRLPRFYLILGLVGVVGYPILGVATLTEAHSPPYTLAQTIFFTALPAGFWLMSFWIVAAYYRERLIVTGSTLVQRGVFGCTTIWLAEVTRAKWRCCPHAVSVRICAGDRKARIYLQHYSVAERIELIALFRESIAPGAQQGWDDRLTPSGRLVMPYRRAPSVRAALLVIVMLAALSFLFLHAWSSFEIGLQWAAIGIALGLASLLYVWRTWRFIRRPVQPN